MIHALACPAAAPRPTAAVERAARAALRTATGNGNREREGALNPLSWAAGASAAGRLPCLASPFFGGDTAKQLAASQLAAHSATMGRSAISHGELAALLVDGEASMPSAWLYAPFEQQQSARSSTKPPSPLFADVCTAPPPPAIQSGEAPGMNTSRSRKRSRHEHEAHQQKLKKDVKRLHEMLAKQAKRREDAPSFAAAAQKAQRGIAPFPLSSQALWPPPPPVALGACWAWPEARNRPRAAEAEAELTARRAAPVLGFSALLAFHARQCAVTALFATGAAPQALKKSPHFHGPHMY